MPQDKTEPRAGIAVVARAAVEGGTDDDGKVPSRRLERMMHALSMDPGSRWLSIEVEPPSRATEPWPRRLVSLSFKIKGLTIGQFPNAPLAIAFVGGLVSRSTAGSAHSAAQAISAIAITIWGYEELAHGVNWFRHALGLYSLVGITLWLAGILHA